MRLSSIAGRVVRPRIKVCGITRLDDALCAAYLGVDAIGLVFYPASPRYIGTEQAAEIIRRLPAFVTTVGLFVNAAAAEIERTLAVVPVDMLQFHGDETPDECEHYGKPYIKALRMHEGVDIAGQCRAYRTATAMLLDTHVKGVAGGTGKTFDWAQVPAESSQPIILAGGLTAENVAQAIVCVHPYGVDVSGGIETAKGIKDHDKMAAFVRSVNSVITE